MSADRDRFVQLGRIVGAHGVRGWIKVLSFTEPRTNLFDYPEWDLLLDAGPRRVAVVETRDAGKRLLAKLDGIDDRDSAAALAGVAVGVPRSAMPSPEASEYYWADLEGLRVKSRDGTTLGTVERLLATGANDVLVLDGERMIPFVAGEVVTSVDLAAGEIVVEWDESYWD